MTGLNAPPEDSSSSEDSVVVGGAVASGVGSGASNCDVLVVSDIVESTDVCLCADTNKINQQLKPDRHKLMKRQLTCNRLCIQCDPPTAGIRHICDCR